MKRWLPITLLLLVSCTNETALELEITASEAVPAEVASWELRLYQLAEAEVCPSAEQAASAARVGRLAHAQSFADVGMSVGEIPAGRWGMAVIARDDACGVRMYGCTVVEIGGDTFSPIPIRVEPATATATCGGCRTCGAGACDVVAAVCD